ncbi:DNA-directed RNA polymerase III subunit RPC4 isoform X2 [Ischnura elegans]|uniref:DNA-directed RNA polymerase III subunit RPC4 isoform X2 n=1 Tax=Ischnura elegans TaxID=197161 RepID=UPI001ED8AB54|nr:DNA-directed RNA polymerase III subunit RPC4 isoform X2 [Ischnura elegans]
MSLRKEDLNSRPLENGTSNLSAMQGRPSPTISPKRLPSFKPPRDLTLGLPKTLSLAAKPKKKFAPNVATRRNKTNESVDVKPGDDSSRQGSRGKRGKWENRGGGRGGQRNNRVYIQSTGSVFGEGIGEATKRYHANDYHSHSRESSGGGGGTITKTRLNLERHEKVDKKEEDLKLEALMSCNFIDDPHIAPDENFRPIVLPLIKELKTEPGWEGSPCLSVKNCIDDKVVVKVEPGTEEEEKPKIKEVVKPISQDKGLNEYSVMELIEHSKKGYMLFQLPTCLPGPKPDVEPSGKAGKSQGNQPSTSGASTSESMDDVSEQLQDCTLHCLPEGRLGTLRIYESGRSEICLNGGYSLVVNPGTQVGFSQELVSVVLDESTSSGKMIVLGPVCSTLNCTPDLEKMILASEDGNS